MWWGKPQYGAPETAPPEQNITKPEPTPAQEKPDAGVEPSTIHRTVLAEGVRALYTMGEFCDVVFVAGGQRFPAHKAMLAAMSKNFHEYLNYTSLQLDPTSAAGAKNPMQGLLSPVLAPSTSNETSTESSKPSVEAPTNSTTKDKEEVPGCTTTVSPTPQNADAAMAQQADGVTEQTPHVLELDVNNISMPEAMKIMLNYIYEVGTGNTWEYQPASADVNKDILCLARHFALPHLHEHAARWLTKGLTTANVVERMVTCEEFGLGLLRDKIIEQLTANPTDLMVVSSSPEIMKHPQILQELLMRVASLRGVNQKKKGSSQAIEEIPENEKQSKKKVLVQPPEETQEKPQPEKPPAKRSRR